MGYVHGTCVAYEKHKCRCDLCRNAHNARVRRSRAERLAEGRVAHGTAGWDDGCRCEVCTTTHRALYRDYYRRMTTADSDV